MPTKQDKKKKPTKRKSKSEIQSVIFQKDHFTPTQAKKWLKENDLKGSKLERTKQTLRFTQNDAKKYDSFGNKRVSHGVYMTFGWK